MTPQEQDEFREYVAGRSAALLRTAYLLSGNRSDAEDLLQTALAKAYLGWPRIRSVDNPDAYVRRIMLNQRTSWWRRSRGVSEVPIERAPDVTSRDDFADLDLHDALWGALASLPRRQRAVLVLRYYEQLSETEIAAALGISEGTVKSQASRALAKLRENAGLTDDPRAVLPLSTTTQGARP